MQTFRRPKYLLECSKNVTTFTDHRNFLFSFHPTTVDPSLGYHKELKAILWTLYISEFSYTIKYFPGERNTMAYIVTHWMCGWRSGTSAVRRVERLKMVTGESIIRTSSYIQDQWISRAEIREVQQIAGKPNGDF